VIALRQPFPDLHHADAAAWPDMAAFLATNGLA